MSELFHCLEEPSRGQNLPFLQCPFVFGSIAVNPEPGGVSATSVF